MSAPGGDGGDAPSRWQRVGTGLVLHCSGLPLNPEATTGFIMVIDSTEGAAFLRQADDCSRTPSS